VSDRAAPESFFAFSCCFLKFVACAGAQSDLQELTRVENRLKSLNDSPDAHPFWLNRTRGYLRATLQDRVAQVRTLAESCQSALALVHRTMFPLNEQPRGFGALMRKFHNGEAIKGFVRAQLVAGARVALAFARVHHPSLNLEEVGRGLPAPPGGGYVDMREHYAAADAPAENIIRQVEVETDRLVERPRTSLL